MLLLGCHMGLRAGRFAHGIMSDGERLAMSWWLILSRLVGKSIDFPQRGLEISRLLAMKTSPLVERHEEPPPLWGPPSPHPDVHTSAQALPTWTRKQALCSRLAQMQEEGRGRSP